MGDNDQTVGYLRHAEIKHGRVAMAAFLGYCVQCLDVVKGEHTFLPYRGYVADVTPQEQWDNIPVIGKLQILTFVGMLESYGEIPGDVPHYTAPGGKPGYSPPLVGKRPELLLESKGLVVPPLDYIEGFPKYSGDVMVPFEGQFHANEALGAWTEATLAR